MVEREQRVAELVVACALAVKNEPELEAAAVGEEQ